MDNYLNWTFDYKMHQKPSCDFYQKITELLEQRQYDTSNHHCYYILPNFHFNHQNPEITDQNDLVIGKLVIQKRLEQKKWVYSVQRTDSTSGEKICIMAAMNNDASMSLTDYRILHYSINGKTTTVQQENISLNSCALTSVYGIPGLIRKNCGKIADFSFMDRHGQIYTAQKIRKIGTDMLKIKEKYIRITGYCLLGYANPPSYWWMDGQERLLIVSTSLLTYVAGPCSEDAEMKL